MCNDRSWKSCSIVTIVFTSLLMLGMFIAVGVMNSMFGDNMQCYVDASHEVSNSRRQMFEGMDKIAALHPSGDGIALGKQALINVAQTFGLGPAVSQLPAFRSLAPEGRKLSEVPPNDNSCTSWYIDNGMCDDDITWGLCDCGTDLNDCGYRSSEDCTASPPPPPYTWGNSEPKSDAEMVDEVEKVRCPPPTLLRAPPCSPAVPAGLDRALPTTHSSSLSSCPGRARRVQPVHDHSCHFQRTLPVHRQRADSQRCNWATHPPRSLLLHCDLPNQGASGNRGRLGGGGRVRQPPGA
jgi:hypothetical protein